MAATVLLLTLIGYVCFQFLNPHCCLGIAGCAPVTARGQRTPRAYLWTVWDGGSFELAGFEEPLQKNLQPFLDGRQVVFDPLIVRHKLGPLTARLVRPGGVG